MRYQTQDESEALQEHLDQYNYAKDKRRSSTISGTSGHHSLDDHYEDTTSGYPSQLILFSLASTFGCDGGVSTTETLEPDVGQVFFEPTLDMSSSPDLGEDEETRIFGEIW